MPTQQAIRRWFNRTYSQKGLSYLRPPEFYSVFMKYLGVAEGDRVLDVGCGPGLLLGQALAHGAVAVGVDLSESALAMIPKQAPGALVSLCSGEALCWPSRFFDYVTCIGVFEHFLQPGRALDEMRRVIKPEGRICIMVPNSRTLKWQMEANVFRIHDEDSNEQASTLEAWREVFLKNGFAIQRIYPDEWPAYERRRRFLARISHTLPADVAQALVPAVSRLISTPVRGGDTVSKRSVGRIADAAGTSACATAGSFAAFAARTRRVLPLRFANQFVFILRS